MQTGKYNSKNYEVCSSLLPRWEVIKMNLIWDEERLLSMYLLDEDRQDKVTIRYLISKIMLLKSELKYFNYLFN